MEPKAFVFDTFGTVVAWRSSVTHEVARHLDRPTEWKLVRNDDSIPRAIDLPDSKKRCA